MADERQGRLIDVPEDEDKPVRVQRVSSKGIAPGDIVEVDKKGRRFHAIVTSISQGDSGRFDLELRPINRGISHRTATIREVVGVWRKRVAAG
jgi:hypothetical protein